jgi:hypothetical protein
VGGGAVRVGCGRGVPGARAAESCDVLTAAGIFGNMLGFRTGLMGAVRPQSPHRSPRQGFGGERC